MINYIKKWLNLNFYVSELDQFLQTYRQAHPKISCSQKAEIQKYQTIYQKRDNPETNQKNKSHFDELF